MYVITNEALLNDISGGLDDDPPPADSGSITTTTKSTNEICVGFVTPYAIVAVDVGVALGIGAATRNPFLGALAGAAYSRTGASDNAGAAVATELCSTSTTTIDLNPSYYDNGSSCTNSFVGSLGSGTFYSDMMPVKDK
ncbi:hypothetical protein ACO0LM_10655 [Undibacterium sp. Di26W]|uniref:hypothetical protein n=1 Tax=Undibacterium sp. Di26W TaxID=3413035 RepID=UPI003BF224E5